MKIDILQPNCQFKSVYPIQDEGTKKFLEHLGKGRYGREGELY